MLIYMATFIHINVHKFKHYTDIYKNSHPNKSTTNQIFNHKQISMFMYIFISLNVSILK